MLQVGEVYEFRVYNNVYLTGGIGLSKENFDKCFNIIDEKES